jgi:hypothetical protein
MTTRLANLDMTTPAENGNGRVERPGKLRKQIGVAAGG